MTSIEANAQKTREQSAANTLAAVLISLAILSTALCMSLPRVINEWGKSGSSDFVLIILAISVILFFRSSEKPLQLSVLNPLVSATNNSPVKPANKKAGLPAVLLLFSALCIFSDAALEEEALLFAGLWTGLLGIICLNPDSTILNRLQFPVFLLVFCLPVPQYVAYYHFHYPLQRLSAIWTAGMLDLAGYEATVSGTIVSIGTHRMHIVEECSGIKFLAILLLFSVIAGHLNLKNSLIKRIMLFLAAVPVAILTNVIRLSAAGMIMFGKGEKAALDFLHGNSVLIFYLAAIFLLAAITRLFTTPDRPSLLFGQSDSTCSAIENSPQADDSSIKQPFIMQKYPALFYTVIIIWSIGLMLGNRLATAQSISEFKRNGLEKLHLKPTGWLAEEISTAGNISAHTPGFASAAQNRKSILTSPSGRRYELEIVWWPQRRPRNRLIVFHQSVICSMGVYAGGIHSEMKIGEHHLSHSLISEKSQLKSFYYWLQSEDQISTRPYFHAIWQYWRELKGKPADGCFVLIAAAGKTQNTDAGELSALLNHIRKTLQNWLSHNPKISI